MVVGSVRSPVVVLRFHCQIYNVKDKVITGIVQILLATTGAAIVALLVSKQSNTSGVVSAGGSGLGCAISTALSPITGSSGCNTSVMSSISFPSLSDL